VWPGGVRWGPVWSGGVFSQTA